MIQISDETKTTLKLKKKAKLIKTDDFSSVFSFRKRVSREFLVFHYQPNLLNHARLGLVVGKKIAKHAVDRNYMKRVLRELFREHQAILLQLDLIVRVQKKFNRLNYQAVHDEYQFLLLKLNQRLNKND